MEDAAKAHNVACAISGDVVEALQDDNRLSLIGHEKVRGIAAEIPIFEYLVAGESCARIVRLHLDSTQRTAGLRNS